jgi:glycosyltransferase involved in cell wall biosynthesis
MITHGVDGLLVKQADEQGLADSFVLLAQHPEERRRLGQAARERAEREFDTRQTARCLLEAIKQRRSDE